MIAIRVAAAFVGAVLIAGLLASPFAMWSVGQTHPDIDAASAWTVMQLSLALGLVLVLFFGTLWLLAGLVAWAVLDE